MYYDRDCPATKPPEGSRLEAYMRHMEEIAPSDGLPWQDPCWAIRLLAVRTALREEPRLWRHHPTLVRDHIIAPALFRRGLPKKYLGANRQYPRWLRTLLDATTEQVQVVSGCGWRIEGPLSYFKVLLLEIQNVIEDITGLPFDANREPNIYPAREARYHALMAAAFFDTPDDMSTDKRCELVARRLGVHFDAVRFSLAESSLVLSGLDDQHVRLWFAAIDVVREIMRKLDQADGYSNPTN